MAQRIDTQLGNLGRQVGALGQNVVKVNYLTAVNGTPGTGQFRSSISGRGPMVDLTSDLGVRMGIERIMTQQLMRVDGEAGPNGEPVYKPVNDKFDQIRFVGGWASPNNANGAYASSASSSDFIEIQCYCTGLNFMSYVDGTNRGYAATVDGTAGNTVSTVGSSTLEGRNYASNHPFNIASGLAFGLHTIKLQASGSSSAFYGFEILNEQFLITTANTNTNTSLTNVANTTGLVVGMDISGTGIPNNTTITTISGSTITMSASATASASITVRFGSNSLKVSPGQVIGPYGALSLGSVYATPYNAGFESGTLGSRGGRASLYLKKDNTIGKAINPAGSQLNLASADHSNEEVVRNYFWREFGAGRSDDLSIISAASGLTKAFTSDDGSATLSVFNIGTSIFNNVDSLRFPAVGAFATFTFNGTGCDIVGMASAASASTYTVTVDGNSIGSLSSTGWSTTKVEKIVSGLPYGTHTVKITQGSAGNDLYLANFIAYGPKKPALPSGAVELADYNVEATYAANTTAGINTIGTGLSRKSPFRECVFSGSWTVLLDTSTPNGVNLQTTSNGAYFEYTFWGYGFEFRGESGGSFSATNTVSLQNLSAGGSLLTLNNTNFPNLTTSNYGGHTFTYSSGNLAANGASAFGGFTVSGLAYGLYKVRIANGTTNALNFAALDIVTLTHVHKSNGPFVLQNTLSVGNGCVNDDRKFGSQLAIPNQATYALGVAANPSTASTSYIPLNDMNSAFYLEKPSVCTFSYSFNGYTSTASTFVHASTVLYVDGAQVGYPRATGSQSTGASNVLVYMHSDSVSVTLQAGWHTAMVFFRNSGTAGTVLRDDKDSSLAVTVTPLKS